MWQVRRRSCSTIYTHPEIVYQVIHTHSNDKIEWHNFSFLTVGDAMDFAERESLV